MRWRIHTPLINQLTLALERGGGNCSTGRGGARPQPIKVTRMTQGCVFARLRGWSCSPRKQQHGLCASAQSPLRARTTTHRAEASHIAVPALRSFGNSNTGISPSVSLADTEMVRMLTSTTAYHCAHPLRSAVTAAPVVGAAEPVNVIVVTELVTVLLTVAAPLQHCSQSHALRRTGCGQTRPRRLRLFFMHHAFSQKCDAVRRRLSRATLRQHNLRHSLLHGPPARPDAQVRGRNKAIPGSPYP